MAKYAIIETGSKQYKVKEGDIILIEKIDSPQNQEITFDKVLLISDNGDLKIGTPYLENAKVIGNVISQEKAKKVIVFKYRRRKSSKTMRGHRQVYTKVKILRIEEA